jgi:hypothetical protein
MVRTRLVLTVLATVALSGRLAAAAPESAETPPPAGAASVGGSTATPAPPGPSTPSSGSGAEPAGVTAGVPMVDAASQSATAARYGLGARLRLTSIPKWMLGLFLTESVPLTSYTAGVEFFRRSGSFDLVLGIAYQPLSPSDGNWLGKSNPAATDTDYVQFRGLAAWSFDAAFIMHTEFNEYVGMHYGGGIGIGITAGQVLRTSNGSPGCVTRPGDVTVCHPVLCATGPCTEGQLQGSQGGTDSPGTPSRFSEGRVPTVYPIVNIITGLDVRLPNVPGFAVKFDLGYFFPYFFFGLSTAYQL